MGEGEGSGANKLRLDSVQPECLPSGPCTHLPFMCPLDTDGQGAGLTPVLAQLGGSLGASGFTPALSLSSLWPRARDSVSSPVKWEWSAKASEARGSH